MVRTPVGAGASITLDGAGSTNSGGIFQVWTKSYRFSRDDITYLHQPAYRHLSLFDSPNFCFPNIPVCATLRQGLPRPLLSTLKAFWYVQSLPVR